MDKPRSSSEQRYKRRYRFKRLLYANAPVYELYKRGEFLGVGSINKLRCIARKGN